MALRLRVTWEQGRFCTLRADRDWSLHAVKEAIAEQTSISPQEQKLFYQDRRRGNIPLPEERALSAVPGYTGDLQLVRCHPRTLEWQKRIELDWSCLEAAPKALQADFDTVLSALRQDGSALRFAAPSLRADRQLVHFAVQQSPLALEYAEEALREDWEIVSAALAGDLAALQFAGRAILADRQFVLGAVAQSGCLLAFVADELRADREIVLAAVQDSGSAMQFAVEDLRADREIVMAAVRENPYALEHAASDFVPDDEVMRIALGDDKVDEQNARSAPEEYRWMGFSPEKPEEPPVCPAPSKSAAPDPNDDASVVVSEAERLSLAVHWRLEPAALVHRWAGHRLRPLPCCADCIYGRHLWCRRCGPAAMPEAAEMSERATAEDPERVRAEGPKVRKFIGAGLSFTALDLQACAFKGAPS